MTPHALLAGFLLSLALIGSIAPPPAAGDAIDDTIRQGMTEGQIPGVALAVVKNGEVVLTNHTPQKGMENAPAWSAPSRPSSIRPSSGRRLDAEWPRTICSSGPGLGRQERP
jgi:CubicO group peptidase (beta-lactamase class C family)